MASRWSHAYPTVSRYALDITFSPGQSAMSGTREYILPKSRLIDSTITFFLHGECGCRSIIQSGKPVKFSSRSRVLQLRLFSDRQYGTSVCTRHSLPRDSLIVYYHGYFNPSKARSPSDYMRVDQFRHPASRIPVFTLVSGVLARFDVQLCDNFQTGRVQNPRTIPAVFVGKYLTDTVKSGVRISPGQQRILTCHWLKCRPSDAETHAARRIVRVYYPDNASAGQALKVLRLYRSTSHRVSHLYDRNAAAPEHYVLECLRRRYFIWNVTVCSESTWATVRRKYSRAKGTGARVVASVFDARVPERDPSTHWPRRIPSYFHLPVMAGIVGRDWYNKLHGMG